MNLHVLLQAALLVEAPPTELAAERLLARVDAFVPLQVPRSLEAFPAVGADEALLEHQPLHRPPPHRVVQGTVLARAQEATAGGVQAGVQGGLREAHGGIRCQVQKVGVVALWLGLRDGPPLSV